MTDQTLGRSPTGETNIERIVMRRVRLIRLLALIVSTAMLAVLTFVAALWGIGKKVWMARILENMPQSNDFSALTNFWLTAFLHTRLIVQVLTILTLTSLLFLAREIIRAISSFCISERA